MRSEKYKEATMREAAAVSCNVSHLAVNLGLNPNGGNHRTLQMYIAKYGIDISHFKKGVRKPGSKIGGRRYAAEQVFSLNYIAATVVRKHYMKTIEIPSCVVCGLTDWLGQPISLHMDHINGLHYDNRLENLRLLCPNCHQQTETWGNHLNRGVAKQQDAEALEAFVRDNVRVEVPPSLPTSPKTCIDCGKEITRYRAIRCKSCAGVINNAHKLKRPDKEEFLDTIRKHRAVLLQVGNHYGVSDNAIRKWCDYHGLPKKRNELREYLKTI